MELKIGMYVRTKHGIGRVDETEMFMDKYFQFHLDSDKGRIHNVTSNTYWNSPEDIIGEPSYDVIDLIDEGDYVNGKKVTYKYAPFGDEIFNLTLFGGQMLHNTNKIESIVTKEQFNAMRYMVKGEKNGCNE